jgi:hypothetical protein
MEETGVLENPDSITRLLPAFEPGPEAALENFDSRVPALLCGLVRQFVE